MLIPDWKNYNELLGDKNNRSWKGGCSLRSSLPQNAGHLPGLVNNQASRTVSVAASVAVAAAVRRWAGLESLDLFVCCGIEVDVHCLFYMYIYEGGVSDRHTHSHTHERTHTVASLRNDLMVIFKNPMTVRAIAAQIS